MRNLWGAPLSYWNPTQIDEHLQISGRFQELWHWLNRILSATLLTVPAARSSRSQLQALISSKVNSWNVFRHECCLWFRGFRTGLGRLICPRGRHYTVPLGIACMCECPHLNLFLRWTGCLRGGSGYSSQTRTWFFFSMNALLALNFPRSPQGQLSAPASNNWIETPAFNWFCYFF